jgi:hypothetical protein
MASAIFFSAVQKGFNYDYFCDNFAEQLFFEKLMTIGFLGGKLFLGLKQNFFVQAQNLLPGPFGKKLNKLRFSIHFHSGCARLSSIKIKFFLNVPKK